MKSLIAFIGSIILLLFSSCEQKGVYVEKEEPKPPLTEENDFTFQTKTDKTVEVIAINGKGNYAAGVPFYFYTETPYTDEGDLKDISPIFYGITGENGILTANITVPDAVKILYIRTDIAGFGGMQTYQVPEEGTGTVTFRGPSPSFISGTRSSNLKAEEEFPSIAIFPETVNNVYTFYEGATDSYNGLPAYTTQNPKPAENTSLDTNGSPLVNYKGIVSFVDDMVSVNKKADELFPELNVSFKEENKYLLEEKNNTDLVVTSANGAEIWATYIGDGGFSLKNENVSYNTLCYFHYPAGTIPDASTIRKNILFPNTDPECTPSGIRVQLLYWDGNKYTKVFPKGTKIGWCMIQNGYGKESNMAQHPNRFSEWRMKILESYRYSLAPMNKEIRAIKGFPSEPSYNQFVGRFVEELNGTIYGAENRVTMSKENGKISDDDFNDILFFTTSNPVVKPNTDINDNFEDTNNKDVISELCGTLAFEDMHPSIGDYDHNDVVIDYKYNLIKSKETAQLNAIQLDFLVRGAGGMRTSGFGIELPQINKSDIANISENVIYESDCSKPVFIIYNNIREVFGGTSGIINTYPGTPHIPSSPKTVRIDLKTLSAEESNSITVLAFNPFIFVDNRGNETHLIDYKPTTKNTKKFGTMDDKSDGVSTFYRSNNGFAWALDITKANSSAESWYYPKEGTNITEAYPGYTNWASGNHTNTSWFDRTNGIEENLYIPPKNTEE